MQFEAACKARKSIRKHYLHYLHYRPHQRRLSGGGVGCFQPFSAVERWVECSLDRSL